MPEVSKSRTLVKSPPELWSECSDARSLARHLGAFGEIRITRLEPETAVAWEGERASGTVRLEPSGWGTRVVRTATPAPPPEPLASTPLGGAATVIEPAPVESDEGGASDSGEDLGAEPADEGAPEPGEDAALNAELPDGDSDAASPGVRGLFARLRARWRRRRLMRRGGAADAPPDAAEDEPSSAVDEAAGPPDGPTAAVSASGAGGEAPAEGGQAPVAQAPPATPSPLLDTAQRPAPVDPAVALTAALDSLGRAHHRPFSRP
jgi:hypothetical protein